MTAHLVVCGVGGVLAMAGHFPHRPRLWVPHALGLAAMLLAWLPAARPVGTTVALLGLGTVLVWQLTSARAAVDRRAGAADTVAMAALIGLTVPGSGTAAHTMPGMDHAAADGTLPYAVAVLVVWLVVRRGTRAGRDAAPVPPAGRRVLDAVRFCGGLVMLTSMTVMLG